MGLGSLASDCLGLSLQKSSSARWQDDWEADYLSNEQINYAAADGAVALDIFYTLCFDDEIGKPVSLLDYELSPESEESIEQICNRFKSIVCVMTNLLLMTFYS